MIQYIENIDILFSISIYRVVSYFSYHRDIFYKFFTTLRDWKKTLQMGRVNDVEI